MNTIKKIIQDKLEGFAETVYQKSADKKLQMGFKAAQATDQGAKQIKHSLSGEVGLSHLQKSILIDFINDMLLHADLPVGHILFWRFVGVGKPGKPDVELVLKVVNQSQVREVCSGVIKIKTIMSGPSSVLRKISMQPNLWIFTSICLAVKMSRWGMW
jgi:hypothetical protein